MLTNEHLVPLHDDPGGVAVGGDDQLIAGYVDFEQQCRASLGSDPLKQEIDEDVCGQLARVGCDALNVIIDQRIEFCVAHICTSLVAHGSIPCWRRMRCFHSL